MDRYTETLARIIRLRNLAPVGSDERRALEDAGSALVLGGLADRLMEPGALRRFLDAVATD